MPAWIGKLLAPIFLALGEFLLSKGKSFIAWLQLQEKIKDELKENTKRAEEYQKVVDKPDSTREERRRAEDDLLS